MAVHRDRQSYVPIHVGMNSNWVPVTHRSRCMLIPDLKTRSQQRHSRHGSCPWEGCTTIYSFFMLITVTFQAGEPFMMRNVDQEVFVSASGSIACESLPPELQKEYEEGKSDVNQWTT